MRRGVQRIGVIGFAKACPSGVIRMFGQNPDRPKKRRISDSPANLSFKIYLFGNICELPNATAAIGQISFCSEKRLLTRLSPGFSVGHTRRNNGTGSALLTESHERNNFPVVVYFFKAFNRVPTLSDFLITRSSAGAHLRINDGAPKPRHFASASGCGARTSPIQRNDHDHCTP